MKKAQLLSQPFVIIFTLLVAAFIIFFGYRAISGLLSTGEQVCHIKFQQDVQNEVNDLSTQPIGSSTRINTPTCGGIKGVCLVNLQSEERGEIPYKDVRDLVDVLEETNGKENLFFSSTQNQRLDPLSIDKLSVTKIVCDDTLDGAFTLILENKGRFVDAHK